MTRQELLERYLQLARHALDVQTSASTTPEDIRKAWACAKEAADAYRQAANHGRVAPQRGDREMKKTTLVYEELACAAFGQSGWHAVTAVASRKEAEQLARARSAGRAWRVKRYPVQQLFELGL